MQESSFLQNSPVANSKGYIFDGVFSFDVECSINKLFKILSNTSKVNKKLQFAERFESESNGKNIVETRFLGREAKWIELPWQWSFGEYIVCDRIHEKGYFHSEHAVTKIVKLGDNKYNVSFHYVADIKFFLLKKILDFTYEGFGKKFEKVIQDIIKENDDEVSSDIEQSNMFSNMVNKLVALNISNDVAKKMSSLIYEKDDDEVFKIKLYELVRKWKVERRELISSFVKASKAGIFEICWDVICPHCKGSRATANHLQDLLEQNECSPCELVFDLDDLNLIDVTFKIADHIRKVKNISYCAGEPHKKEHILFQNYINPKETVAVTSHLEEGYYRARLRGKETSLVLNVTESASDKPIVWNCRDNKIDEPISCSSSVTVFNDWDDRIFLTFESMKKSDTYLSPLEVFSNQDFQNLYSNESIKKGVQLKLPSQIVLFTDVIGSTKFYERVGDKEAYTQIKRHFDIIEKVTNEFEGMIIKTIGDAVMISFNCPKAVFDAVKKITTVIDADETIEFKLRFSVHKGPMIAVNYNTGIDYFGNNVNISAKLQAISEDDEISMSEEFFSEISHELDHVKVEERPYLEVKVGHVININDY